MIKSANVTEAISYFFFHRQHDTSEHAKMSVKTRVLMANKFSQFLFCDSTGSLWLFKEIFCMF